MPEKSKGSEESRCQYWLTEIEHAFKRTKQWLKDAKSAVEIYEGEEHCRQPFNILYANAETLCPAIYNSTPRPDVAPRYRNGGASASAAAGLAEAYLSFFIDSGDPRYPSFDSLMRTAILSAVVPGRGATWLKYDAEVESDDAGTPVKTSYELVCAEDVPYDHLLEGYGRTWQQVPWIGRVHFYSPEEASKDFPKKHGLIKFVERQEGEKEDNGPQLQGNEGAPLGVVYEIWDKRKKQVLFITPGAKEFLKQTDDPLKLEGFFPTPEPLKLFRRLSSNVPQTLYVIYENQAKELNRITVRIQKIIEALKVRGFYDSQVESISRALEQEDNVLLPAENLGHLHGRGGKLEDAIFTFPIEKLVTVLQQLYVQREQVKVIIYEVMGISDILRGSTVASETATAQTLKDRWGSLRLRRFQQEAARYCRDCLRIASEIAFTKLAPETIRACTGSTLPSAEQKAQAEQAIQFAQQSGMPPPPEMVEAAAQPAFEEVLALLQSDLLRRYNIDIEANSSVDAEATEEKQDINDFMTAMGAMLDGLAPLIESGSLPFEAAKTMLLAVVKRFRFGREVEDQIRAMQPPQPKMSPEEVEKAQEEIKQEMEKLKAEQAKLEDIKRDIETERKEFAADVKIFKAEQQATEAKMAAQQQVEGAQREASMAKEEADRTKQSAEDDMKLTDASSTLQGLLIEIQEATKAAEMAKNGGLGADEGSIKKSFAQLEKSIQAAIEKQGSRKMRAVKQTDGSWVRETLD